ncbi:hypothetical protein DC522_03165 [Microvirga sp. KLBC 81]|uniref:hypothetical protein n=1 Tax=Microvirga sp. KLBC 81 TaxID=1862707 RepID=UPI000D519120|nr:hypothetical protein [Microvirga sp. KLBC 81]PVE25787.1 hypothetical protein DC522_03165 [Microvirga sp. KLBC 81]
MSAGSPHLLNSSSNPGEIFQYPEGDIRITTDAKGLFVSQHGRSYLAREWRLTSEVLEVLQTALEFGLTHLWQEGHPSKSESHHISFSFSHAPQTWVFVIGKEAKPPNVRWVTFHQKFKGYLREGGFLDEGSRKAEWENSGGKNILVRPEYLHPVLSYLPLDDIKAGQLPQIDKSGVLDPHRTYIKREKDLEDELEAMLRAHPKVRSVARQRQYLPNVTGDPRCIPDLIVDIGSEVLVLELKPGNTSEADVAQPCRYRVNKALVAEYQGRSVRAVLAAANFQQSAVETAILRDVSLYAYEQRGRVTLELVRGQPVLDFLLD